MLKYGIVVEIKGKILAKEKDWRKSPSKAIIDAMLKRFGVCGKCGYSLNGYYKVDFEIQPYDGGTNTLDNFMPLCSSCASQIKIEDDVKLEDKKPRKVEKGGTFNRAQSFPERRISVGGKNGSFNKR